MSAIDRRLDILPAPCQVEVRSWLSMMYLESIDTVARVFDLVAYRDWPEQDQLIQIMYRMDSRAIPILSLHFKLNMWQKLCDQQVPEGFIRTDIWRVQIFKKLGDAAQLTKDEIHELALVHPRRGVWN